MKELAKYQFRDIAFILLFAAEFTYYLLILQTGVVEYHHSDMREIWMMPVGGVLGITASIWINREQKGLLPALLGAQLLLSLGYPHFSFLSLFGLGVISGLTAPMLIARIPSLLHAAIALGLSYAYGTYYFDVDAGQRDSIAIFLTLVALAGSLFEGVRSAPKHAERFSVYSAVTIFLWLLLDSALFERLSRDSMMSIWGDWAFTPDIILFHITGLWAAYRLRDSQHNDAIMLGLFFATYATYDLGWQFGLSIIYPFVISYYNVTILSRFMRFSYPILAVMAVSLWAASGMGLLSALTQPPVVLWGMWAMLAALFAARHFSAAFKALTPTFRSPFE